jgi:hypothetical protein
MAQIENTLCAEATGLRWNLRMEETLRIIGPSAYIVDEQWAYSEYHLSAKAHS